MACVKVHGWSIAFEPARGAVSTRRREEQRRHPHGDSTTEEGWR